MTSSNKLPVNDGIPFVAQHPKTGDKCLMKILPDGRGYVSKHGTFRPYIAGKIETRKWVKISDHEAEAEEKPNATHTPVTKSHSSGTFDAKPEPKPSMIRALEADLNDVRGLPCQYPGCDAPPPSQASHRNRGKGMGIKAHDLTAAICGKHHAYIDQGKALDKEDRDHMWLWSFYNTVVALIKNRK